MLMLALFFLFALPHPGGPGTEEGKKEKDGSIRYVLETAQYILNLVPFKFVPKTPRELWSGRKPSLQHKGCPALVLKVKTDNLELKLEVNTFIEYSKGTKGWLFYNPRESRKCLSAPMQFFWRKII